MFAIVGLIVVTPLILPLFLFAGGFIRRLVFLPVILGARCDPEGYHLRLLLALLLTVVAAAIDGRGKMILYLAEFRPRPSIGVGVCNHHSPHTPFRGSIARRNGGGGGAAGR